MRIELLRHGECDDQAWLRGRVDSALSVRGWQQMQAQFARLKKTETILSSPAKRCVEFSQTEIKQAWSKQAAIQSQWQERDFGIFDGLSFETVKESYPKQLAHYLQEPYQHDIPEAELFSEFKQRIHQAWSELIQMDVDSILVLTHSGPMRLVLQQILGFSNQQLFQFELGYAASISIEVIATDANPFCKLVEIVQSPRSL
ncbi:MAG: histidine phosphatase family protein [Pseudomonadota bacterium]|nr:histidine phosphatase family protein [Pseudomonadota bacterium]